MQCSNHVSPSEVNVSRRVVRWSRFAPRRVSSLDTARPTADFGDAQFRGRHREATQPGDGDEFRNAIKSSTHAIIVARRNTISRVP